MSSPISSIASLAPAAISATRESAKGGSDFKNLFEGAINRVESLRQSANQSVERALSGEGEELHSTVMATQRAELSFELFMQVRNKVVSAYQEVMRMQL
jgi:flagellar hook-basal body complex protein FliE